RLADEGQLADAQPFPGQRLHGAADQRVRLVLAVGPGAVRARLCRPAVRAHESHNPSTIQRTRESFAPTSPPAPAPSFDTITKSETPAPRLSIANSGSPSSLPSGASGCTTSRRQPRKLGCLVVETARPATRATCMGPPPLLVTA